MRRLRYALGELVPGSLCGAFVLLAIAGGSQPNHANRLAALLIGGLYGASVVGLLRLFRISRFGLPFAGLVAGPVPFALLISPGDKPGEDVGGIMALSALMGAVIGVIEWARQVRAEREARLDEPI